MSRKQIPPAKKVIEVDQMCLMMGTTGLNAKAKTMRPTPESSKVRSLLVPDWLVRSTTPAK